MFPHQLVTYHSVKAWIHVQQAGNPEGPEVPTEGQLLLIPGLYVTNLRVSNTISDKSFAALN